jgi:predicted DNA-binding protein with PD1-like motif
MSAPLTRTEAPFATLAQPGPARPERWLAAGGALLHRAFDLAPGRTLLDAVAGPLAEAGMRGGVVHLSGGSFSPFCYVMPALSSDPRFAAYYSETYRPAGETRLERASVTFGERDGAGFLHVHGTWIEPDGRRRAGHLLPAEVVIAEPVRAEAWGSAGAAWRVIPDAETNFSLFTPVALTAAEPGCLLLKIQPNEEIHAAIEAACAVHGLATTRVRGIGSIVRPAFADRRVIPTDASEVLIRDGIVRPGPDGGLLAHLDIAVVDVAGAIHEGVLLRGANAACITFELCLTAE